MAMQLEPAYRGDGLQELISVDYGLSGTETIQIFCLLKKMTS